MLRVGHRFSFLQETKRRWRVYLSRDHGGRRNSLVRGRFASRGVLLWVRADPVLPGERARRSGAARKNGIIEGLRLVEDHQHIFSTDLYDEFLEHERDPRRNRLHGYRHHSTSTLERVLRQHFAPGDCHFELEFRQDSTEPLNQHFGFTKWYRNAQTLNHRQVSPLRNS